jgi:hypothetical protein
VFLRGPTSLLTRTALPPRTGFAARFRRPDSSLRKGFTVAGQRRDFTGLRCNCTTATFDRGEANVGVYDYQDNFKVGDGESLEALVAAYDEAETETDAIVRALDLGEPVPVPKDVPWFPADVDAWSVRWVLLHLITETARHAGHADIIRESIDGATGFSIMAAAEHWPVSPWITPWTPAD